MGLTVRTLFLTNFTVETISTNKQSAFPGLNPELSNKIAWLENPGYEGTTVPVRRIQVAQGTSINDVAAIFGASVVHTPEAIAANLERMLKARAALDQVAAEGGMFEYGGHSSLWVRRNYLNTEAFQDAQEYMEENNFNAVIVPKQDFEYYSSKSGLSWGNSPESRATVLLKPEMLRSVAMLKDGSKKEKAWYGMRTHNNVILGMPLNLKYAIVAVMQDAGGRLDQPELTPDWEYIVLDDFCLANGGAVTNKDFKNVFWFRTRGVIEI